MNPEYLEYAATERQKECVEALIEHGTYAQAADALGINVRTLERTVGRVKQQAARKGFCPENDFTKPTAPGFALKRVSTHYDDEGSVNNQWVIQEPDKQRQWELAQQVLKDMAKELPQVDPRPAPKVDNEQLMSVYPMGDPHVGLYSYAAETGADFDLKIAERDLCEAMKYLVQQSPPSKRGVIINLGDFFHVDNYAGKTERGGNILDVDSRLPKVYDVGMSALRQTIDSALEQHEIVEVMCVPGNHDDSLSMALAIGLKHIYEKEPRIVIHGGEGSRYYVQHGKVLIGAVHGDKTKDRDLPGIMAAERPEQWGQTKHRYFYRGHYHHDEKMEYNGCTVEQFRTLAAGDAYAVGHGYLSGRDMKLIVHHAEYGEVSRSTCSIDMLRS